MPNGYEKIGKDRTLKDYDEDEADAPILADAAEMAACCLMVYHEFVEELDLDKADNDDSDKQGLLELSNNKYAAVREPEKWVEIARFYSETGPKKNKKVVIAQFGTLGKSEPKDYVVICRGTQLSAEWAANVNIDTVDFTIDIGMQTINSGKVHKGFLGVYEQFRRGLMKEIGDLQLLDEDEDDGKQRILVTGHSLGAALATLTAYEISVRVGDKYDVFLYNFASPRVGKDVFQAKFDAQLKNAYRFVNSNDIVTTVPLSGPNGFYHVGNSFTFKGVAEDTVAHHDMFYYQKQLASPESFAVHLAEDL